MVQVNITKLIDEVQCYQTVRELRWPDGILCPSCQSKEVIEDVSQVLIPDQRGRPNSYRLMKSRRCVTGVDHV